MVKLKVDNRDVTEEEAAAAGGFADSPQPGLYRFRVEQMQEGFSKGEDGKPDKSRPYIEVTFKCAAPKYAGALLWTYLLQPGHPSYNKKDKAKQDQFLRAIGFLSNKKRTGEFDSDKHAIGKYVTIQVRAGKNQSGEYRGEVSKVFPDGHEGAEGGDLEETGDEGLLEEGEEVMGEETDWDARRAELMALDAAGIKAVAKEWKEAGWDITISGTKSALADAIIAVEQAAAEQEEGGDDEELTEEGDEELLEDDEEIIEDDESTSNYLTQEQLSEMDNPTLVATAKDFDITVKGMKKSEVIAAILKAQAAPGDAGEFGEEPF